MDKRLEFHQMLVDLVHPHNVYFQPPSSIRLEYPCIIYELGDINTKYADSIKYANSEVYTVTLLDKNPRSDIFGKLLHLNYCAFDRFFATDNINHFVFTLFYS